MPGRGKFGDLLADHGDGRMILDFFGDALGKEGAVHGQGPAGRNLGLVRRRHDQGAQLPHLFFKQTHGGRDIGGAQGIAADQLGQLRGLVRRAEPHRLHLMDGHPAAALGSLPGGLASREAAADDSNFRGFRGQVVS